MPSDGGRTGSLPPAATDAWARELAAELADRLDSWAMEREKILSKLDIRGAKAARALARSLRQIAKLLQLPPEATLDPERKTAGSRLVMLRRDALRLMSSGSGALTSSEIAELERQEPDEDEGPATVDRGLDETEESKQRPTLSPPDPTSTGGVPASAERRKPSRDDDDDGPVTGAQTPDSLRGRRSPPAPAPQRTASGLGDYIARIRKLKG